MGLYKKEEHPAWKNCYHFVSVVYKRRETFRDEALHERVKTIFMEKAKIMGITVHALAVAHNHVHILVQSCGEINSSQIGQRLNGYSAFYLRKEFPLIFQAIHESKVWGGNSVWNIRDESHFQNVVNYIKDHRPDNTKD